MKSTNIKDYKINTRILYKNKTHVMEMVCEGIILEFSDSDGYVCIKRPDSKIHWRKVEEIDVIDTVKSKALKEFEDRLRKEAVSISENKETVKGEVWHENQEAEAIEEECRMTEEDYDKIDWNRWMKENSEESKKEKPKEFEVYPYAIYDKDKPKYFLEIYNGKIWKLCLRNDFWSSNGHPYKLGEGKIAHEGMIHMYTLTNLKRIVDGLNLQYTKHTGELQKFVKHDPMWQKPLSTSNPMPNITSP